jgi:hypothetical protein
VVAGGLAALFVVGYFALGLSTDPGRSRALRSSLDRHIPFVAQSDWLYLLVFPLAFMPLFVVPRRA